jgi:tetratricopeptide (TPR) repeat protein
VTVLAAVWLLAAGQLVVPPAMDEAERQRQAKVLLDEALRRYNAAEYEPAIESFKAAYALAPAPGLLFNIAQAYRLAGKGHCLEAVRTYKSYLEASPSATNRDKVEGHLKSLEACAQSEQRVAVSELHPGEMSAAVTEPAPQVVAPVEQPAPPSKPRWPPLMLGVAGLALSGAGLGTYYWSDQEYVRLRNACGHGCLPGDTAAGRAAEPLGVTLLTVGILAVVAAAIWWISL